MTSHTEDFQFHGEKADFLSLCRGRGGGICEVSSGMLQSIEYPPCTTVKYQVQLRGPASARNMQWVGCMWWITLPSIRTVHSPESVMQDRETCPQQAVPSTSWLSCIWQMEVE